MITPTKPMNKPGEMYQSMMKKKSKNWIAGAIKKPGALRAELGAKGDKPIPGKKLAAAAKKGGKEGKRARLAQTLKSFHKKMTQKQDDAADKKAGRKEGSKADVKQDRLNGIKDKKRTTKKKIDLGGIAKTVGQDVNKGVNAVKNGVNTVKRDYGAVKSSLKGYQPFNMENGFDRQVAAQAKMKKTKKK